MTEAKDTNSQESLLSMMQTVYDEKTPEYDDINTDKCDKINNNDGFIDHVTKTGVY